MDFIKTRIRVSGSVFKAVIGGIGAIAVTGFLVQLALSDRNDSAGPLVTGTLQTQRGEHRRLTLPDGSSAYLNTNTVLRFRYSRLARNIELVSGEVLLTVNSGDTRPFSALSGGFLTRDLSTEFDLRKKSTSSIMTVTNGGVRVTSTPLNTAARAEFDRGSAETASKADREYHRLDQVEFDESTGTLHEHPTLTEQDLSQLLAWQLGRINLNGLSLSDAFAEFSRYARIDTVIYADPSLRSLQTGGEFESGGFRDFLQLLPAVYHIRYTVKTTADGNTTVTLSRRHGGANRSKGN